MSTWRPDPRSTLASATPVMRSAGASWAGQESCTAAHTPRVTFVCATHGLRLSNMPSRKKAGCIDVTYSKIPAPQLFQQYIQVTKLPEYTVPCQECIPEATSLHPAAPAPPAVLSSVEQVVVASRKSCKSISKYLRREALKTSFINSFVQPRFVHTTVINSTSV